MDDMCIGFDTCRDNPDSGTDFQIREKQLGYLRRNLGIIRDLMGYVASDLLSITLLFQLDILDEVYQ